MRSLQFIATFISAQALLTPGALAQRSSTFDLTWNSIDGGGAVSASPTFTLLGAIGQPDATTSASATFALAGGFLGVPAGEAARCVADCDESGSLDFFDFLCFQNLFAVGDPKADCDASGTLDFFDFLCFQNEFARGCP